MTKQAARAEVVIDLDAIAANTAVLRDRVDRPLMAVVKADGYGHGLVPAARAALAGGADALGVAVLDEALALRAAGMTAPLLAWLHGTRHRLRRRPGRRHRALGQRGLGLWRRWWRRPARPDRTARAAPHHRHRAVPGGRDPTDWPGVVAAAARAQADGDLAVVGLWSHMAYADAPTHPTIGAQVRVFEEAVALARRSASTDALPAPGELRRDGRPPRHLVRHGPPGRRPLRTGPARR